MKKLFIKYKYWLVANAFLLIIACQYELTKYEQPTKKSFMSINANISNEYARVDVEYSVDEITLDGQYSRPPKINAIATIKDSKGKTYSIKANGTIDTTFKGVIGETYTLTVEADGKKYESLPEKMLISPEIDSIVPVFRVDENLPKNDAKRNAFDVILHGRDFPESGNFYQWDWIHYERAFFCGTMVEAGGRGRTLSVDCDSPCWDIAFNSKILIYDDKLTNGQQIKVPVARITFATPPSKYYLKVEQRGITKTAMQYLTALKNQSESNGTLFDTPSQLAFSPNIKCTSNPDEKVLGLFNVFSVRKKIIYINMPLKIGDISAKANTFPPSLGGFPAPTLPCIEGLYRTKSKPDGWVE